MQQVNALGLVLVLLLHLDGDFYYYFCLVLRDL